MLVVLDTNMLVGGLMNAAGKPGKVIDLALENRIQIAYDDRILGEYEDVLARPELHIHPARAKTVIAQIELTGQLVEAQPISPNGFQDPDDLPFAEVWITSNAQALVTGNLRHFSALANKNMVVVNPDQFIEQFFPGL